MSLTPKVANTQDSLTLTARQVAPVPVDDVLRWLDSSVAGLSSAEASARLVRYGPNAVRTHHVNALAVLGRQLRNAVLILLAGTAVVLVLPGRQHAGDHHRRDPGGQHRPGLCQRVSR